jgi:hypothetical protein
LLHFSGEWRRYGADGNNIGIDSTYIRRDNESDAISAE